MTGDPHGGVVELRRYTLHPGQRDVLIALFEREFIETQEAVGLHVLGQFRDLDAPDRFVWLRGSADMAARRRGLEAFYGGPVWAAHRAAANATMVDSDDVHLLRPAWPGADAAAHRGRVEGDAAPGGLVEITVFPLRAPADAALIDFCRERMAPLLREGGARALAWWVTEPSPNDFVRLPVHEGQPVLVGLALFDDAAARSRRAEGGRWARDVQPDLAHWLVAPPQLHRLVPTPRSALR